MVDSMRGTTTRKRDMIEFSAGESTARGYLAVPQQGAAPGVLVLHAWWGLTDVFTMRTHASPAGHALAVKLEHLHAVAVQVHRVRIPATGESAGGRASQLACVPSPDAFQEPSPDASQERSRGTW